MTILAVDDERGALNVLCRAVGEALPGCRLHSYTDPREALNAIARGDCRPDAAFLDVEMFGLTGLEMAKRLKEACPCINVVFVTGYAEYMREAFALHASGYLLKPVRTEDVRRELEDLRHPVPQRIGRPVQVRCFGNFEVFARGQPLSFCRSKSKELLAYLVMRRCAGCSTGEIAAALWEDSLPRATQQGYLRHLVADLSSALKDAGAEGLLLRRRGMLAVNPALFDCDYYDFIHGDIQAVNAYHGEYMAQYSWAEFTIGYLDAHAGAPTARP